MSDIVERLKSGTCGQGCGTMTECVCATAEDAADEITRLRAEVENLGNRLHHVHRLWANNEHALRAKVEKLKASRDLVLEEAARVVRRMPSPSSEWMADELLRALGGPANQVPEDIRALKNGIGDTP